MKLVTSSPECHIATATKPLVDALLAMNTRNRAARQTAIDRLRQDIEAGGWQLTASGVGVDKNGVLSDGQHRLMAIRDAGYPPVQFLLMTGLDPESQAVVDRHAKRGLADALSLVQGRTISSALVAANNAMLIIKNATSKDQPFVFSGAQPSDMAASANLLLWEDDLSAVMSAIGSSSRASVVAAVAIYHRHDKERALIFADQVRRGIGLQENDPAYRLRTALSTVAVRGGAQGSLRAFSYAASAIIAHSQNRQLKMLRQSESWAGASWKMWQA